MSIPKVTISEEKAPEYLEENYVTVVNLKHKNSNSTEGVARNALSEKFETFKDDYDRIILLEDIEEVKLYIKTLGLEVK